MIACFKRGLIAILLALAFVFSITVVAPQVYAAAIISHPGGTIIDVNWGEAFLLRHRLEWLESGEKGYYSITIYWDCFDDKPSENFTFENASAYFDNGDVIGSTLTFKEGPAGTGTRYAVSVWNATGDFRDGQFTVDIWLRAAGAGGVPHSATDNHPIYYSGMDVAESSIVSEVPSPITVRVHELSVLLHPSDDADVYERCPDNNYGSSTSIWVSPYDNRRNRGFLKFGLGEIPSSAVIRQAKLYLNCWRKEYENFDAACCGVENDGWSENAITWNSQPNYGSGLDNVSITGIGWYAWNVTDFVSREFGGDNIVSFCLKGAVEPHGGRALFDSKEWYRNHPYLEVKYILGGKTSSQSSQSGDDFLGSSDSPPVSSTSLTPHDPIYIEGNDNFTSANGVVGGRGTENDPYIIENWHISAKDNHGIWIRNTTAYFVIRNCVIENGRKEEPGGTYGVLLGIVVNGRIENNTCKNNRMGISIRSSSNNILTNNKCSYNVEGIYLENSDNNPIENNQLENNSGEGIGPHQSHNNILINNICLNNQHGIILIESDNNTLTNNICLNNKERGIFIEWSSDNNTLTNNTFSNNQVGIYLDAYSDNNLICHNNFMNNTTQAYDIGTNYWDNGYPSGGNYWSGYTGVDNYRGENQDIPGSDNIGDTPYNILPYGYNRDHYPLMNPVPFSLPWIGTAVFRLENLYKVSLNMNLWINQGSKLVAKFFTYENLFENEVVIHENFALPWKVVPENENVPHPLGEAVENVILVLTADNTENVISIVGSFIVTKNDLWNRLIEIRRTWPFATSSERDALWREITGIRGQWPYAPS